MSEAPVTCRCCGSQQQHFLVGGLDSIYARRHYEVVVCDQCGNGITLPVETQASLDELYADTYLYPVHECVIGEKRYRAEGLARFLRQQYPASGHARVLEIGCMFGYLMEALQPDYRVKGIDLGTEAIRFCRERGLDAEEISVEDYLRKPAERFDLIILSHVFEHLVEPDVVLRQLKERLNPNGRIVLLIPNRDSIARKVGGRNWGWWQVPVHIHHFTENALRALAAREGFRTAQVRYRGGDSLMWVLTFMKLFGVSGKGQKQLGGFQRLLLRTWSGVGRYWYPIGNEELTVVLER
jgi:SAM-dependent methyltransferase